MRCYSLPKSIASPASGIATRLATMPIGATDPNAYAVIGPVTSVGVGASGAIFGIFGAFIAYNFKRRHLELASANLRWAATLLLLNLFLALAFHGIDWRAHLGGLVAGLACGVIAEGWGTASQRRMVQVLGFASLIAIGVGLVLWRTDAIQALPIYQQIFG